MLNINTIKKYYLESLLKSFIFFVSFHTNSQEIRVTDNKGTISVINNNKVTAAVIAPTLPLKGDTWFKTSTPTSFNIWDGTTWIDIEHTGLVNSVFFAGTDGKPTENNIQFNWNNTTNTLFPTNLNVSGTYIDSNGNPGTSGQVLSSTITGTSWVNNLSNNIYNSNGTLDTPRNISGGSLYPLTFDDINNFSLNSINDISTSSAGATTIESGGATTIISGGATVFHSAGGIQLNNNTSVNANLRLNSTLSDINNQVGTSGQILSSTATGVDWIDNPASNNWLITGNTGTNTSNFLGTIDDVRMQIRSNNLPILEFGRRQTLNLVQTFPDYTDVNQPLVYLRGNGNVAALQFAASGASFYKPMFFTTTNGSFRLKGSSGNTDFFEIGSGGPSNDGRLEFIVGDDGPEPIIFKRYDYRNGQFHKEFFRVQGSNNTSAAKTRFGININSNQIPIDSGYDDPQETDATVNVANSTLQINGSVSKSILRTGNNITLTEDHHTIIATNTGNTRTVTLPIPNTCTGRIYIIKTNRFRGVNINGSNFQNSTGLFRNNIDRRTVIQLQSDGVFWQQIN